MLISISYYLSLIIFTILLSIKSYLFTVKKPNLI